MDLPPVLDPDNRMTHMSQTTLKISDPLASHKAQAKLLRAMLASDGITVNHSEALERVAQLHGQRDWNTLCAQITAPNPVPLASGVSLGTFSVSDWQYAEEIAPGAVGSIDFEITVDSDGINIGAPIGDDARGLKVEIQDGAIRVMAYDERVGESPAILIISADGDRPIRADLHDHFISANFRMISPMEDAPSID
jgi:hypothetical protein